MRSLFLVGIMICFSSAYALTQDGLVNTYQKEKEKVVYADQKSREIMSTIYEINQTMKNVSKKRNILNTRLMDVDGNVQILARQTAELSAKLNKQKSQLARRLRGMYMLGGESVVRVLFSSASAQDLDQSLKYLKLISRHDFSLIRAYKKNLKGLEKKKERLNKEVKSLITIKERIKHQEEILNKNHASKSMLLARLRQQKDLSMKKLSQYRGLAEDYRIQDLINLSFFEQKGQLPAPVSGKIARKFGPIINERYQYRLSHKGHQYVVEQPSEVKAVFSGRVVYVGQVEGHGWTVVVDHGDHYYSVYTGADRALASENALVKANQPIAWSNEKLYFEIRYFSDAIDPSHWLKET